MFFIFLRFLFPITASSSSTTITSTSRETRKGFCSPVRQGAGDECGMGGGGAWVEEQLPDELFSHSKMS
jgi:hypothetical protein